MLLLLYYIFVCLDGQFDLANRLVEVLGSPLQCNHVLFKSLYQLGIILLLEAGRVLHLRAGLRGLGRQSNTFLLNEVLELGNRLGD